MWQNGLSLVTRAVGPSSGSPASCGIRKGALASGNHFLSGLLNVLNDIAAPEGRIVFMTTKNIEALDPAFIRSARVDVTAPVGKETSMAIGSHMASY